MENISFGKTNGLTVPWSPKEISIPKDFTDLFTKSPDDACLFEMFLNSVAGKDLMEGIYTNSNKQILLEIFQTAILPEMKKLDLTWKCKEDIFLKFEDPYSVAKMRIQAQELRRLNSCNQVAKTGQIFKLSDVNAKKFEDDFVSLIKKYSLLSGEGNTGLCYNFLSFTFKEGKQHETN